MPKKSFLCSCVTVGKGQDRWTGREGVEGKNCKCITALGEKGEEFEAIVLLEGKGE